MTNLKISHSAVVRGCYVAACCRKAWYGAGPGQSMVLSDGTLEQRLALVGFGCDPTAVLDAGLLSAWLRAGGVTVQLRHSGPCAYSKQGRQDSRDAHVPRLAPAGWVAMLRPDRSIAYDGPLEMVNRIVRTALDLLGTG